jgi:alkyl hydroperoxide reductase subunit F
MANIKVYTKNSCGYCSMAKSWLKGKNLQFEEVNIEENTEARDFVISKGHRTMPQIYIDDKSIGGYTQLIELDASSL